MKNSIFVAAAVAVGAVATALFIKKRRRARSKPSAHAFVRKSHHRTDVFSKAKDN